MVWPAIIGAAATIGSAMYSASAAAGANKQSRKFAREQREWDLNVANTAHQREIEDLRAAGLNPILSGTGGPGSASPNAAGAQTFVGETPDVAGAISSGLAAKRAQDLQEEQIELLRAQKSKTQAEEDQVKFTTNYVLPQSAQESADRGQLLREQTTRSMFDRGVAEQQWERGYTAAEWQRAFEHGKISLDDAKAALKLKLQQEQIGSGAAAQAQLQKRIAESSEGELAYLLEKLGVSGTTLFSTERNFTGPAGDWIERKWEEWKHED